MRRILIIAGLLMVITLSQFAQSPSAGIHNEIDNFCCEHFRNVMDEFFAEVTKVPGVTGHVIIYEGQRHDICSTRRQAARGEIDEIVRTVRNHIAFRNVDPTKFSVVKGGYRRTWYAEFWIVPTGAAIPKASPTHSSKNIKYKKRRGSRMDLGCS